MNNVCVVITTTLQRYEILTKQVYVQRLRLR